MSLADFIDRLQRGVMPLDHLMVFAEGGDDAFERITGQVHLVGDQAVHVHFLGRARRLERHDHVLLW